MAIARTLLKNPPILVFDEATSALDSKSERTIQRELDSIARERTTLIIAHRLSTVTHAKQIIVMDHGRIVERGTLLSELLAAGGLFAQMWALQQQARRRTGRGRGGARRLRYSPHARRLSVDHSIAWTPPIVISPCACIDVYDQRSYRARSRDNAPNAHVASTPNVAKPI